MVGESSFVPGLWLSSLLFFCVNVWILGIIVSDGKNDGRRSSSPVASGRDNLSQPEQWEKTLKDEGVDGVDAEENDDDDDDSGVEEIIREQTVDEMVRDEMRRRRMGGGGGGGEGSSGYNNQVLEDYIAEFQDLFPKK